MASYKESSKTSTVGADIVTNYGADEPGPKVRKLTASPSSADEPAGIQLEDHSTEDLRVPQADILSAEEGCSTECSSCSVFKQENWQLKNRLRTSKEEIRRLKNKLKTSKDSLKSRRNEQKRWQRKGIVQANDYIQLGYKAYDLFCFVCDQGIFLKGYAKNYYCHHHY